MMNHQGQEKDKEVPAHYKCLLRDAEGVASMVWGILIFLAAAIIFTVSLADQETRAAYEKVNTVPVENSGALGKY